MLRKISYRAGCKILKPKRANYFCIDIYQNIILKQYLVLQEVVSFRDQIVLIVMQDAVLGQRG